MYMSCWFSIKVNIIFCLEMCLVEQTWFTQAESNLKEILVTTGKRGIDNKKTIMNNHLQRNAKLSLFFCTHFNPDTWIQMQMICIKYCKQTSGNIQLHPTSSNFIQLHPTSSNFPISCDLVQTRNTLLAFSVWLNTPGMCAVGEESKSSGWQRFSGGTTGRTGTTSRRSEHSRHSRHSRHIKPWIWSSGLNMLEYVWISRL